MTITPHRDAIAAAGVEARRRWADLLAREDAAGIGQRMAIEAAEAVLGGAADMMDRGIDPALVWPQVGRALADTLSGFLISTTRGDPKLAEFFLPGALASIQEQALARLRKGPAAFAIGEAGGDLHHPAGRA